MTTQTQQPNSIEIQTTQPVEVVPTPPWKEVVPLNRVLQSIARDSRRQTESYLDEVVVPHGGE